MIIKQKKEIGTMYYVPDGTKKCGYYECKKCGNRFLSLQTMEKIPCPDCEAEIDYEIGPDESMEDILDTAQLLQKIEGEEEVEKMDALLSLAITGGGQTIAHQNHGQRRLSIRSIPLSIRTNSIFCTATISKYRTYKEEQYALRLWLW